jgi:AAA+ superfamily predicted ATPase
MPAAVRPAGIGQVAAGTAKNVRAIFDFVPKKGAVLFLDEMDAIAKVRDDKHELGEVKRVVNTVLQGLDALDHEAVVIAATNHPHLLDPAIWRRFPYKIELGLPDRDVRHALWSQMSEGLSGADIETISHAARRHALIGKRAIDYAAVAHAVQQSKAGKPTLPSRSPLDRAQIHSVITTLAKDDFNAADIGRLVGITRQAVRYHLNQATPDAE